MATAKTDPRYVQGTVPPLGYYEPIAVTAGELEHGWRLSKLLERRLGVSRKLLSRLKLTDKGLMINGVRAYSGDPVSAGDICEIRMEQERSDDILAQPLPLEIVFEDKWLLLAHKPSGMVVHPTHGHYTGTLANAIVHHWQQQGENVRFRPVHRLDEDTSGLVLIAKNPYVHQQLSEQHSDGRIRKGYLAFAYGAPVIPSGRVDAPIDRDPDAPHYRIVTPVGYPSATLYETADVYGGGGACKLRLRLETGRTHQIRVHMGWIGCSLIGDRMYGPAANGSGREDWERAAGRQALHAERLSFQHPMTGEEMSFSAPLPPDLAALETLLRGE
ncbi:RluA family pseudouridine synthase [Paenibacillus pasadenensis]|uniref:RluA family pseudouridine synthase n=1 Tax=Paenibacillus pasadenensis TaxID=217090 RepID=UPI00203BBC05|nr:RluA family pseudouridine synthase [Paenibacillus pasadenensis]